MSRSTVSHEWSHLSASKDSSHQLILHDDGNVIIRDVNNSMCDAPCSHDDDDCDGDGCDDVEMFDDY